VPKDRLPVCPQLRRMLLGRSRSGFASRLFELYTIMPLVTSCVPLMRYIQCRKHLVCRMRTTATPAEVYLTRASTSMVSRAAK
jgi:hypothetical protein